MMSGGEAGSPSPSGSRGGGRLSADGPKIASICPASRISTEMRFSCGTGGAGFGTTSNSASSRTRCSATEAAAPPNGGRLEKLSLEISASRVPIGPV
jgi:hypothetical protein